MFLKNFIKNNVFKELKYFLKQIFFFLSFSYGDVSTRGKTDLWRLHVRQKPRFQLAIKGYCFSLSGISVINMNTNGKFQERGLIYL